MFIASGSDDQVTLWDLAVERDSEAEGKGRHLDVPPQLLFIHMVNDCELSLDHRRQKENGTAVLCGYHFSIFDCTLDFIPDYVRLD